jgi:hypothetical protein
MLMTSNAHALAGTHNNAAQHCCANRTNLIEAPASRDMHSQARWRSSPRKDSEDGQRLRESNRFVKTVIQAHFCRGHEFPAPDYFARVEIPRASICTL